MIENQSRKRRRAYPGSDRNGGGGGPQANPSKDVMSHEKKPMYMENYVGDKIDAAKPTYAPDGILAGCWRKVRPGGRVKMGGTWWNHEALLDHAGRWVWCEPTEYWHVATNVFHNRPGMRSGRFVDEFICKCT